MDKQEVKKPFNISKVFRNISLLSIASAFGYFFYVVFSDIDKKMTESEALNLTMVLLVIGSIGGLSFIAWIFLWIFQKINKRISKVLITITFVVFTLLLLIQSVR